MRYEVKIKTGFYETTTYYLNFMKDKIQLVPVRDTSKNMINLYHKDFDLIMLSKGRHSEIEINLKHQIITGTFNDNQDLTEILQELKKTIKSKIVYKEE